jgi:sec-independent protein translocase protein TatA
MGVLQPGHLIIILLIVLMIFGAGKLPEVGSALGRGIKEFKKSTADDSPQIVASTAQPAPAPPPAAAPVAAAVPPAASVMAGAVPPSVAPNGTPMATGAFCPKCGTRGAGDSRFCASCGVSLPTLAV